MEQKDRSKFYTKPPRFGAQSLYKGEILNQMSLDHWKAFDEAVNNGEGFKVGDFIDTSVNITSVQLVKFLDEFSNLSSLEEVKEKAKLYIEEIQQEIKL